MTLSYISSNSKKIAEVQYFFKDSIDVKNLHLHEIQGNIREVIEHKLDEAVKSIGDSNFFLDDVSCEIKGLHGFPGPYFKDFIKLGNREIEDIVSKVGREYRIICNIGLYYKKKKYFFTGEYSGYIELGSKENTDNLKWDNIIRLNNGKRLSDLDIKEKINMLARGKALHKMKKFLDENYN